ncbi:DUF2887 domain-containing protein [Desulfococcaceae bacterium HSG8]|nr:DUF2887 domain-containing protein [Desulfococcaceae bacterium HSG8]
METDTLFYKLFKRHPGSFFRLAGLDIKGKYEFESITTKTTEKRFDGFLKDAYGTGPNVFSEFQGWDDSKIYWRFFREVFTYYEQTDTDRPFVAVLLFTNKKYDPGECPVSCKPPHRFIRLYLPDCLKKLGKKAGELTVLKPLMLPRKEHLPRAVTDWKAEIRSLELPENKIKELEDLLIYAILQRFSKLTREEVEKMIEMTPIEKTVVGQELIQIGMERGEEKGERKGIEKGMRKGKLIGEIRLAQRILKRPVISEKKLSEKSLRKLKDIKKEMESELYRE